MESEEPNANDTPRSARQKTLSRAFAALVVVLLLAGAVFARSRGVDVAMLQRELLALGWLAVPAFLVAFAIGELLHLPGILFVVAARVVFGPAEGFVLGYVGALGALAVSFAMAKRLVSAARATSEPWRPKFRLLRRAFERIESSPVRSVALLRFVFWLAPPLTYALATTRLRFRDHLAGCAIGIFIPAIAANLVGGLL